MKLDNQRPKKAAINAWFLSFFLLISFFMNSYAQMIDVSGTVSTSTTAVHNASVTFIDNGDTTMQFSSLTDSAGHYSISIVTSVDRNDQKPADFTLKQNYPNPFPSATIISYKLDVPSDALVTIYDILGREIKRYSFSAMPASIHQVVWDGLKDSGERVAAGIYFYRLRAGGRTQVRKMVFGTDANHFSILFPNMRFSQALGNSHVAALQELEFTVRIENTENTFPVIMPKRLSNVMVQNNAVLNFTVEEYINPLASAIF